MWLFSAKLFPGVSAFRSPPLSRIPLNERSYRSQLRIPFLAPPSIVTASLPRLRNVHPAISTFVHSFRTAPEFLLCSNVKPDTRRFDVLSSVINGSERIDNVVEDA